ncbi:TetR/AcrR family transcriptional regulator [Paraburkholderia tropica]|uniref:TetR/AcrR family transcriptional regulator n=1 Tax=Paraburkholderia tropica TaxID=92647 RepID=UPI000A6C2ABA|nr:TetR/AcrR family transcriptional regulator [Paraburkholderia tropica]
MALEESTQGRNRANRIAAILAASTEVFCDEGYAAFAARRVAATVGLTLSNLQYYFPSKESLLKATVESFLDGYVQKYRALAQGTSSPQKRLSALLDQIFVDVHETDVPRLIFEAWALSQHDVGVSAVLDRVYDEYRQVFARLLSEANPDLPQNECLVRATLLVAQTEGLMIFAFRGGDSDKDNAEVIRTMKRSARLLVSLPLQSAAETPSVPGLESAVESGATAASEAVSSGAEKGGRLQLTFPGAASDASHYSRPTKQSLRRAEKMREIISVAADVLSKEGYGNFSQARVAKLAGILPSNLQHYFRTHDDLLHATLHALMTTYLDRYSAISHASGKPPTVRLDEIIGDVLEEICDWQVVGFSFEMFALAQRVEVASELLMRVYRAYREIFVSLIHEIEPEASSRECYARATLIAATMEGLMAYTRKSGASTPHFEQIERFVRSFSALIAQGCTDVIAA